MERISPKMLEAILNSEPIHDTGKEQRYILFELLLGKVIESLRREDHLAKNLVQCAICDCHFPKIISEISTGHYCPPCTREFEYGIKPSIGHGISVQMFEPGRDDMRGEDYPERYSLEDK